MDKFARRLIFVLLAALSFSTPALAAEAEGEWLVADKTAYIRIVECAGALWGIVSWEADPGIDTKNPDPGKRSRTTLGMPVLLGLKPAGAGRWNGALYNSENGKTYSGGITMLAPDRLRVRGCVLGILCGGENWTRVDASPARTAPPGPSTDICRGLAA